MQIVPTGQNAIQQQRFDEFDTVVEGVINTLGSPASERVYRHTYRLWADYARANGLDPLALMPSDVGAFIHSGKAAKSTRKRRLSAIRKMVQVLAIAYPDQYQRVYEVLKLLKVKATDHDSEQRTGKALTPFEVAQTMNAAGGTRKADKRNQALLAVLFYAGLRRSECVALKWGDINFEQGQITVRHGKGDKQRTIPFASDAALDYLKAWRKHNAGVYIFPAMTKGDKIRADKPMTTTALYLLVKQLGFAPHDARRTLITSALNHGTPISDAQFIAGHANASTTMGYAVVKDANEVKTRLKVGY